MNAERVKTRAVFGLHLFVTLLAWVAPFLFTWKLLLPAYGAVLLQFTIFRRCLMNQHHALEEDDNATFYSHLLENAGFAPDRKQLKFLVRKILYPVLAGLGLVWQLALGYSPLLF